MASSLAEIQRFLVEAVQGEGSVLASPALALEAGAIARGSAGLSPAEQVAIYREQFFLRHLGALADDYEGLRAMLGEERFEALGRAYLRAHPPRSHALRDLGAALPAFLAEPAALVAEGERGALIDMARLEWALVESFDAADLAPLDPAALAGASAEAFDGARLRFDPALRLLALGGPVHARLSEPGAPLPAPRPTFLVVWRDEAFALRWREVEPLAFRVMQALGEGLTLSEALDGVASGLPDAEVDRMAAAVGGWFRDWVESGFVRAVHFPAEP